MTNIDAILELEYQAACARPTDIHMHLPQLKFMANMCDHVTEFGVRSGESSRAILSSSARHVRMYDLNLEDSVRQLVHHAQQVGKDVQYVSADTLQLQIEQTDMLFIDTLHTHDQLLGELRRHAWRVNRFLAFHDTHTFGLRDEDGYTGAGLLPAILTYMTETRCWNVIYHTIHNNGFTILERAHS